MQYLFSEDVFHVIIKMLTIIPQLAIVIYATFKFGYDATSLPFCMFLQIFTLVTYNSVVTSQYFIWFLSLLPISLKNLEKVGYKSGLAYVVIWLLSQCGWLLPAYFLEFKGWNTFDFIWLQGILFYSANIYIMQRLILNFRTFM
jgi:phosphatidylinositol glycan class M